MDKKESKLSSLNIVYVSDVHVGCSVKKAQLKTICDKVNELHPDVFLLDGDVFDEGSSEYYKRQTVNILSGVKAKYGSYYVEGNHDDYGKLLRRNAPTAFSYFEGSSIEPLRDEMKLIADSFYVIGRLDKNTEQTPRRKLAGFETEMKKNLPVFVFDHQARTDETRSRELLQLSGHTHNGQIFPASILDPFRRVNIYGAYKRDKMQLVISSGVGTYGVPNRLGNFSEMVNVKITLA
jgi:predicted MPP superfamily phosphohydrolase